MCSWLYCMFQKRGRERARECMETRKKDIPNWIQKNDIFFPHCVQVILLHFHSLALMLKPPPPPPLLLLASYTTFWFCRPIFSDFPMNFPLCFNFEWKSYKAGRPKESKWIEWRNWEWEIGKARATDQPTNKRIASSPAKISQSIKPTNNIHIRWIVCTYIYIHRPSAREKVKKKKASRKIVASTIWIGRTVNGLICGGKAVQVKKKARPTSSGNNAHNGNNVSKTNNRSFFSTSVWLLNFLANFFDGPYTAEW